MLGTGEGRNKGGRVATPTSFKTFDSYDMKSRVANVVTVHNDLLTQ